MMGLRRAGGLSTLLAVLLMIPVGCTFEQRGNGDEVPADAEEVVFAEGEAELPEVRRPGPTGTVRAFREAVAVGDLSLALALLDRQAFLVDDLIGDPELAGSRGEALLELRSRLAEGVTLEEESSRVNRAGDGAVVMTRLVIGVSQGSPEVLSTLDGRHLTETAVLILTEEGWRIGHFHRSLLPES